jgi:uncharacterized NAD-dependent epimerase/dehydratase family protein
VEAAAVLTNGWLATTNAKTAHGLVRGPSRYRIVGVVDAAAAGRDAGEVLDGVERGIPVYADLAALLAGAAERPRWAIIGIATPGGVLPPDFRRLLLQAIDAGLGIVNGLHSFLAEDAEIAAAAARRGVELIDIRRPKTRRELHFWSGAIRAVRAPRVAVLGTDCALGKRTTCQALVAACEAAGVRAGLVYTGQTGWLQGIRHGFILDSTLNDFVSGELEHAVVACDRELEPDVIFIEGQSALRNSSGPCGAELLLSAESRGVVLQHAPGRVFFVEQERLGNRIPPLAEEIELVGHYGARVLGIALNHQGLAAAEREAARRRVAAETGLPTVYPLLEGVEGLLPALRDYLGRGGR